MGATLPLSDSQAPVVNVLLTAFLNVPYAVVELPAYSPALVRSPERI